MITKRIIPCLDVKDGRVVKGVNFAGLSDVSSPVALAKYYSDCGADELVFYDITASAEGRALFTDILAEAASQIFIPLTVGGGIRTVADFDRVLKCGADKVSVNSGAIADPSLIGAAAKKYGDQCVAGRAGGGSTAGAAPFPGGRPGRRGAGGMGSGAGARRAAAAAASGALFSPGRTAQRGSPGIAPQPERGRGVANAHRSAGSCPGAAPGGGRVLAAGAETASGRAGSQALPFSAGAKRPGAGRLPTGLRSPHSR